MSKLKIGEDVVVIHKEGNKSTKVFDVKYLGDLELDESAGGWVANGLKNTESRMKNPAFEFPSGKKIWGCECWWTSKKEFVEKNKEKGIKIEYLDEHVWFDYKEKIEAENNVPN